MKKIAIALVALAVIGGMIALGIYRVRGEKQESQKKHAAAVAVEAVKPEISSIQDSRVFSGALKPWSLFEVAPKVGGRLRSIEFDVGDPVPGGARIAVIEDTEYRQGVDQARADLEVASAQLRQAEVMLDQRRREYERQKNLKEKEVGSVAQLEGAESSYRAQEAACRMQIAEVRRREAILKNAELKLADCVISAEWPKEAGVRFVGARGVDPGALVSANQPLLSVAELNPLLAEIYVIERDYPYLRQDQPAVVTADAYPGVEFRGKVVRIAQLLQDNTRQAAVRIEIANPDLRLKPGMFVRVRLEFASRGNATVVPRNAVVKRNGEQGVFMLDARRETACFVPVETGIADGGRIEIVSPPLKRPVITLGNHLLTDGAPVLVPEAFRFAAGEGNGR